MVRSLQHKEREGYLMVKLSEANIQSHHAHWCNDLALWLRDVERWQARYDATLDEFRRPYACIIAVESAARRRADTIAMYEDLCDRHAEAIANDPERGRCGAMTFVHNQMAARHAHIKGDHERIKEH
ncbi:unnamed protein product, partial [marine sediment metagenome]